MERCETFLAVVAGTLGLLGIVAKGAEPPRKLDWTKLDWQKLGAGAVAECAAPLAPGTHAKSPFCAPRFAFKAVEGAKCYRFTVTHWDKDRKNPLGDKSWTFEAGEPSASLLPVLNDVPVCAGRTWLRVVLDGLDGKGGKPIAGAPQDSFFRKGQAWKDPFDKPKVSLREASTEAIRHSISQGTALQYTFYRDHRLPIEGNRGPELANRFARIEPTVVAAGTWIAASAAALARETKDAKERQEALKIARNAAESLIDTSNPADWKYGSYPNMLRSLGPHWKGYLAGEKSYDEWLADMHARSAARYEMMFCGHAEAGKTYLDVYDVTRDKKYLDAATRMAAAYRDTQLPSGAWPYLVNGKTGEPLKGTGDYPPALTVLFLDRLASQYGVRDYEKTADRAFQWILDNQVKTFEFRAHFWDVHPRPGGSQGALAGVEIAMCLFGRGQKDTRYIAWGEEYLRRVEDKFIWWEEGGRVSEQTGYMPRIGFTGGGVAEAFGKAFEATGNPLYLAKALTMVRPLMTEYIAHSGGYAWNHYSAPRSAINLLAMRGFLEKHNLPGGE